MILGQAGPALLDLVGAAVVLVVVGDMFLTIFNYDGFTTLTTFFHRGWWRGVRIVTRPLPPRARPVALSLGPGADHPRI